MAGETKTPKTFLKAEYSVFEDTCKALNKTNAEVCESLGCAPDVWQDWKRDGKMPRVASIACEGVRRRFGISDKVYLVKITTKDQEMALQAVFKGLGVEYVNV